MESQGSKRVLVVSIILRTQNIQTHTHTQLPNIHEPSRMVVRSALWKYDMPATSRKQKAASPTWEQCWVPQNCGKREHLYNVCGPDVHSPLPGARLMRDYFWERLRSWTGTDIGKYFTVFWSQKNPASNCAHPSREWKRLIVYRKRCKQLGMRQCNSISVRENP